MDLAPSKSASTDLNDIHDVHVEVLHRERIALGDVQKQIIPVLHDQMTMCLVLPKVLQRHVHHYRALTTLSQAYLCLFLHCFFPALSGIASSIQLVLALHPLVVSYLTVVIGVLVHLRLLGQTVTSYTYQHTPPPHVLRLRNASSDQHSCVLAYLS